MATKLYTVGGILVEATKSGGGGFYELTVVKTGQKQRYLADVFEVVAKPVEVRSFGELLAMAMKDGGIENDGGEK